MMITYLAMYVCPLSLVHLVQGCTQPLVIKIADTEKDKERKRMEKMLQQHAQFAPYGLSNLQLAASSLMNPLSYSQQQQQVSIWVV